MPRAVLFGSYYQFKTKNNNKNYVMDAFAVLQIFCASYMTKCPGDEILVGHGVLMMQKQ